MFILLFLVWIALNARITVEIVLFGLVIASAIYWFMCKFLDYNPSSDRKSIRNIFMIIEYILILFAEIIKSSAKVLNFIYSREIQIEPQIVVFKVPIKSEFLRALLANTITLTPGTITVNVEGNKFYVHALDYTFAKDIEKSKFIKLLIKMEENI
ncbi:MAG: Na+/H+ antiporter subunit E [Clostridia bacterium]